MKQISSLLVLVLFAATVLAQQTIRPDGMGGWIVEDTGGCGGLFGAAKGICIAEQQGARQQQGSQQQLIQQQQIESQRLQNELLRQQLQRQSSSASVGDDTDKYVVEAGGYCNESDDCIHSLSCSNHKCVKAENIQRQAAAPKRKSASAGGYCSGDQSCRDGLVCADSKCVVDFRRPR